MTLLIHASALFAAATTSAPPIDFTRDVRPILASKCFACHGPDDEHREADLRLDLRDRAVLPRDDGAAPIVPGDSAGSALIARVLDPDEDVRMPPAGRDERLQPSEIETLRNWIDQGAPYAPHWSFVPPRRAEIPSIPFTWADSAIDAFLLKGMIQSGLAPSPPADRFDLARRLSLDLCGLPPSIEQVDAFQADDSPDSHERLIDRLLASPAYGERWARVWLDLARYADSAGYASDPLRRTVWRYRDWVIEALNRNMPFDQFTIEQLAGDLLPEPDADQILATAFHRNTMTNTEGGTDDEEFRVAAVKDRAVTTVQVWMGLTLGCAQCHNHKYDPITQKEFYSLYAFFNQTEDRDLPSEDPTAPMPTEEMVEQNRAVDAQIAAVRERIAAPSPELDADQAEWERSLAVRSDWQTLHPLALESESAAALSADAEGVVRVDGDLPANDVYTIEAEAPAGVAAIRLESLPDPTLPSGGAGRNPDGNFVVSRVAIEAAEPAQSRGPVEGRYVRVELPGPSKILSLAEVQVFSGGENVAQGRPARQASVDHGGEPSRAVDGQVDGDYFASNSVTHTKREDNPWWEVDLGHSPPIEKIVLWNRTDHGRHNRLDGAVLKILSEDRTEVWTAAVPTAPERSGEWDVSGWKAVPLAAAYADHSQSGFPVAALVDPKDPAKTGWAVGPKVSEAHAATLVFASPLSPSEGRLRIRIEHRYSQPHYLLGRFRIRAADDPAHIRRAAVPAKVLAVVDLPADQRSEEQRRALEAYFRSIAPRLEPLRKKIAALEASRPNPPAVPILKELPADQRRETFVMVKGNFLVPGEAVAPDVPAALHPMPDGAAPSRLGLAAWLLDERNPLTARVAVNRLWAHIFGRGIVETLEDFGVQGALPSHPEVLDELALDFRERGWDVKQILRSVAASSTYRQSARVSPDRWERDPENVLLSRAPRLRLDAETVRDQALAIAGVLSTKMLGPSVYPYQPDGLWRAAFNGADRTWSTSPGEDRFRRGVYTFWRRTIPYPSMAAFDAPSREICTLRRTASNTPLQAFVTLNDPVYVEAAQALARRLMSEGGATAEERIRHGLRLALGRPAEPGPVRALAQLFQSELKEFWSDPASAQAMATDPLGPLPPGVDVAEAAAWTVVANALLNLDAVLTK